jgi:hypothetical protein
LRFPLRNALRSQSCFAKIILTRPGAEPAAGLLLVVTAMARAAPLIDLRSGGTVRSP